MKDNLNRLKIWLFSYLIIHVLLFLFGYLWFMMRNDLWGISGLRSLIINLLSFMITFFFYLKVTKKTIGWNLITIWLAYFFSVLFALFFISMLNNSSHSFANYAISRSFWIFFNLLFMFAGVFSEQKKAIKSWEDDILDDSNI